MKLLSRSQVKLSELGLCWVNLYKSSAFIRYFSTLSLSSLRSIDPLLSQKTETKKFQMTSRVGREGNDSGGNEYPITNPPSLLLWRGKQKEYPMMK